MNGYVGRKFGWSVVFFRLDQLKTLQPRLLRHLTNRSAIYRFGVLRQHLSVREFSVPFLSRYSLRDVQRLDCQHLSRYKTVYWFGGQYIHRHMIRELRRPQEGIRWMPWELEQEVTLRQRQFGRRFADQMHAIRLDHVGFGIDGDFRRGAVVHHVGLLHCARAGNGD